MSTGKVSDSKRPKMGEGEISAKSSAIHSFRPRALKHTHLGKIYKKALQEHAVAGKKAGSGTQLYVSVI